MLDHHKPVSPACVAVWIAIPALGVAFWIGIYRLFSYLVKIGQ